MQAEVLRCWQRETHWVTHKMMTARENMGHERWETQTIREKEREWDYIRDEGQENRRKLGKVYTHHLCMRMGCAAGLSNIDSLIFLAWPTEITCILISSAHQPTSCVQMRWNVSHTHTQQDVLPESVLWICCSNIAEWLFMPPPKNGAFHVAPAWRNKRTFSQNIPRCL